MDEVRELSEGRNVMEGSSGSMRGMTSTSRLTNFDVSPMCESVYQLSGTCHSLRMLRLLQQTQGQGSLQSMVQRPFGNSSSFIHVVPVPLRQQVTTAGQFCELYN